MNNGVKHYADGVLIREYASLTITGDLAVNGGNITSASYLAIGSEVTSRGLAANGDLVVAKFEANNYAYFNSKIYLYDDARCSDSKYVLFGTSNDAAIGYNTTQTQDTLFVGVSADSRTILVAEFADYGFDFQHALQTDPTLFVESSEQRTDQYATIAYNNMSIGGTRGSFAGLKSIAEEVTIAVGTGAGGVASSGNLAPANSRIRQVMTRVTQAPGGGASTLDAGRTAGGNLDEYTDGTAVALNTTTIADDDGDGVTAMPHWNSAADTITLTTDVNVTVSDMKVRVVVFYEEFTVPTS